MGGGDGDSAGGRGGGELSFPAFPSHTSVAMDISMISTIAQRRRRGMMTRPAGVIAEVAL